MRYKEKITMKKLKLHTSEKGSVILFTIIVMAVLSLLTISAYVSNISDERGAYNIKDRSVALQSAEAALRDAENHVTTYVLADDNFTTACTTDALCLPDYNQVPIWKKLEADGNTGWLKGDDVGPSLRYGQKTAAVALDSLSTLKEGTSKQPRYIIEVLIQPRVGSQRAAQYGEQLATQYLYRITSVGFGLNPNTKVKLQTVYLK